MVQCLGLHHRDIIADNYPSEFAGVVSLCGPFPSGRMPLGNLAASRRLPVLLSVGRDSNEYSPSEVCENLRLFHTAGLSITLRQYSIGQELSPQMLGDVDRWIVEQINSDGGRPSETDTQHFFEV